MPDVESSEDVPEFAALLTRLKRWGVRLLVVAGVLAAVVVLVQVVVNVETSRLWFASVGDGGVYSTILRTRILLFVMFGAVGALAGWLAARGAFRGRMLPARDLGLREVPEWQRWLRSHRTLVRRVTTVTATLGSGLVLGSRAAGQWQTWQLWRNAAPWGSEDPVFHRDLSYYVEVLPMHRLVVTLLSTAVVWGLVVTVVAAALHGSLRLRGPARITRAVTAQLSAYTVAYLLLAAAGYWLDRASLVTSRRGTVTGVSYTDLHAVLPGKAVMIVVVSLVAVLLAVNLVLRRVKVLALGVAVGLVAALVVGSAWPAAVAGLREKPSASTLSLPEIRHNMAATRAAFGLEGTVTTTSYGGSRLHGAALRQEARQAAQIRVLDPNRLSPTFNVKQQLEAYYGFKSTLDSDRYPLDGSSRDVAIAARELRLGQVSLGSWANRHLVYTHGYGVVAAPADTLDASTSEPDFLDAGMPPAQQIPVEHPQIYFGQSSPDYSIVGRSADGGDVEFDHPSGDGTSAAHTTYAGGGGVAIGSTVRRLMYAVKLHDPNIVLSKGVTGASRILTVRDPRARVAAVAPWLTLDGTAYPAVVDGDVTWVVDGYTSSSSYPDSQLVDLNGATRSTLTTNGSSVAQPHRLVNYLHDSVKATVDAYTGQVTLYEWNQDASPDPLLKVWESAFPGLVRPQSQMPASLVAHVRYPQDLFDVQRLLLTRYHVTDAADFYSGNDFWKVPADPTTAANAQINSGTSGGGAASEPSVYMSLSPDGFGKARYSLSSPLVTLNRQRLAGFLSVDSEPGPDYGKFTLLQFPAGGSVGSPSQVQNDIESTTEISEALTLQRGGNSKVVLGSLLTLPLGGRMLEVEPIYTQASGGSSFPILRHVVAIYGDGDPGFTKDLPSALRAALAAGDDDSSSGTAAAAS